jgi:hypothetical protein
VEFIDGGIQFRGHDGIREDYQLTVKPLAA